MQGRGERGQSTIEYIGALLVVAAVIALVAALPIGGTLSHDASAAVRRVFGVSAATASVHPPTVVRTPVARTPVVARTDIDSRPVRPDMVRPVGGGGDDPRTTVARVEDGPGGSTVVHMQDGTRYQLDSNPDPTESHLLRKVAGALDGEEGGTQRMGYRFIARERGQSTPDLAGCHCDRIAPGDQLKFVEVKSPNTDDGTVNPTTFAKRFLGAVNDQNADQVVVVLNPPPRDNEGLLEGFERVDQALAAQGIDREVTVMIPDQYGVLHVFWQETLGEGVPRSAYDTFTAGQNEAKADDPADPEAGIEEPGDGGGDGGGGGEGGGGGVGGE